MLPLPQCHLSNSVVNFLHIISVMGQHNNVFIACMVAQFPDVIPLHSLVKLQLWINPDAGFNCSCVTIEKPASYWWACFEFMTIHLKGLVNIVSVSLFSPPVIISYSVTFPADNFASDLTEKYKNKYTQREWIKCIIHSPIISIKLHRRVIFLLY